MYDVTEDIIGTEEERKSHGTALLLCFFFGALGIHRIYTGYILLGILQLLTGGGFGIWSLVDLISLWLDKFKDSNGNSLSEYDETCVALTVILAVIVPIALVIYLGKGL